ncbi:hypothetical protein [Bradyrhizobium sp. 613_E4_N2_2]|uniref:hypothetical protein n=1 Tax=Bradyrhizobium sp. 613_E4_N2_2 TaxID=3240371 RepID=UPI003F888BF1
MQCHKFARQLARIDGNGKHRRKALAALVRRSGAASILSHNRVVGWRMRDGSVVCAKHRYASHESAAVDLARITHVATHKHIPVRVYPCPSCRGFHLTSKPA